MNIANIYANLKQILNDSNLALINRGLNSVDSLDKIPDEIKKLGEINNLPYYLRKEIIEITADDLKNINSIDSSTFEYYRLFASITLPDSVRKIGSYAFEDCFSLTNITIPDSVTSIGSYAFSNCTRLTSITIPDSVESIGERAFQDCKELTNLYLYPAVPPSLGSGVFASNNYGSYVPTIHVPIGSGDAYKSATNWSHYASKIVEDIVIEDITE